ncbi:RIPOR family member 3-like isoform X6 [Takifugu rubripes]|uniref:RIPOR family member 3-like isoform X6 n=1 Tax=Takifugu rubripes TaxID=31033 RepID=UPI00114556A2|nr:RIPOR family member 3-like isoform X6 [Takifugu rubripes]
MSLKLQFDSAADGRPANGSLSFTAFSSPTGRQWPASVQSSFRSKTRTGHRSARMHPWSSREDRAVWPLQLHDVDAVFQVLLRGLREILESQQGEMDFLVSQQRDTKRDSRLAFIYDLEKEIRALERAIRRVEFQLSKVEELYELYCLQWRLCQGVVNMKKAFARSPPTRACRESLLELNRSHRHSLQDISEMERELEILLGELHIKMKGLIGFARLCPGDQYEVTVQLGRQRWRIRGRIKSDDTQSWEEEHMVFLPHIHRNFEIKVMELKGLSWLLVGMVTCASADFFVSKPQLMLVDITELGTIKLQLEIAWNPFDSGEKMKRLSLSRLSVSARRNPLHGRTAGHSPSFTEKYFLSMARRLQEVEGISAAVESASRHDTGGVSPLSYPFNIPDATFLSSNNPQNATRSSTPDVLRKNQAGEPGPGTHNTDQDADVTRLVRPFPSLVQDSSEFEPHSFPALPTVTIQPAAASPSPAAAPPETSVGQHRARALRIGAQISELSNLLPSQPCSEQELRALRHNLLHLATILKNDLSLLRPSSPQETLGLEEVLGSFDFLSHDINADEDASCLGTLRKPGSFLELDGAWLTSGDDGLDQALEIHLDICCILLQRMRATRFSPSRQELLQELSLQAEALQRVSHLLLEKNKISSTDILPQVQRTREVLLFWEACVSGSSSSPFLCDADSFCATLRKCFTHKVEAKQPGQAEKVFSRLLGQLQAPCRTVPDLRPVCCPDRVTLFQLSAYLRRWGVQDLGAHITRLSKEERILSALRSPKRRRTLNTLRGQLVAELLPLGCTLQTLAALQVDANHKVSRAACKCLCRAAGVQTFRNKATESVDHITEMCRATDGALRSAARETVLSFGKRGFQAFQRMEQLHIAVEEAVYINQETEITVL